jgi:hypothetical protein
VVYRTATPTSVEFKVTSGKHDKKREAAYNIQPINDMLLSQLFPHAHNSSYPPCTVRGFSTEFKTYNVVRALRPHARDHE